MLRKMSDNNEYFLFEDRLRKEFRVYILKNLLADDEYITHTQRQKNLFTMTSGGFVIVVRYNSFIDRI